MSSKFCNLFFTSPASRYHSIPLCANSHGAPYIMQTNERNLSQKLKYADFAASYSFDRSLERSKDIAHTESFCNCRSKTLLNCVNEPSKAPLNSGLLVNFKQQKCLPEAFYWYSIYHLQTPTQQNIVLQFRMCQTMLTED